MSEEIHLTPTEKKIVDLLRAAPGYVHTETIKDACGWKDDPIGEYNPRSAVYVHIHRIRAKLGYYAIKNVPTLGYRWEGERHA